MSIIVTGRRTGKPWYHGCPELMRGIERRRVFCYNPSVLGGLKEGLRGYTLLINNRLERL